jgi:hypothetical protein
MIRTSSLSFSIVLPALAFAVLLLTTGCDDETLGPKARGDIEGQVLDADTDAPVSRASVTTSPPTQSVLTDGDGRFTLSDVEAGNYTVDVSKKNYDGKAVSVRVPEGEVAQATVLLEPSEDAGGETDSLRAEVVDFYNDRVNRDSTGADSVFVTAEYRAKNVGDAAITAYELYFAIETSEGRFSDEVAGDTLQVEQADVGNLRKYVQHAEATRVEITDVYVETD